MDFDDNEKIELGFLRFTQKISPHELFFKVNQQNAFKFSRKKDLIVEDSFGYYEFPQYEAYDELSQNHFIIISNKSSRYIRKTPIRGLFDFIEEKFFAKEEIDFLIFAKEGGNDFSKIVWPTDFVPMVKTCTISSEDELYPIILHYDE